MSVFLGDKSARGRLRLLVWSPSMPDSADAALHVRPEGVLSFRSCGHCLTVFVMSLIILITIRIGRPVFDQENEHSHLQTPVTLIHHIQPMSVDFVACFDVFHVSGGAAG